MKIKNYIIRLSLAILSLGFIASVPVGAQSSGAAQGLQISPALVELNAVRGGTYTIKLNVMNVTAADLVYTSSVEDFTAAGETGSPHIVQNSKLPATASIRTWISTVLKFDLGSHQAKDIIATIKIPNNAEPGGHYGVLSFSGETPEVEGTGVGLSASAGALILIRVDGVIKEQAELSSFYTSLNGKQSSFFENGPVTFITRIQNQGNIHIKPFGNIEVRDMFGGLVENMKVNDSKSNVLPNSIRRFETSLNKPWMVGLYTANLTMGYGTTGQAITNTITFWVIPYKIVLAVLFILITFIYILTRLVKVYNRRIIEKSKNETKTKVKNKNANKS